jgi:CDP-diacylglycerol--serine O-phosphatidyltransferase
MIAQKPKKRFSMIREFQLADWFTLGNAVCGTAAIFSTISYVQTHMVRHVYFACALVALALLFDILDGHIARWREKSSTLGRELDSLADVISFGVAPAMIGYGLGMQGLYDRIVLVYFVACGVSRLARYNVTAEALSAATGKVTFFEGTPIPTSFLLVCLLAAAARLGAIGEHIWFGELKLGGHVLHLLTLLFGVCGSLMIRRIRIPKL